MQSTILELSRFTSDDKPTTAEWTTRLSKPMSVEQGDYIMVKQAFVDTRLIDNNSILIPQDIEWTFQFVYWVNNCTVNSVTLGNIGGLSWADGLPYILIDARPPDYPNYSSLYSVPVVDSFTIKIPQGIYERSYLAEFITRQLQGITIQPNVSYENVTFSSGFVFPIYDASGNATGFTKSAQAQENMITSFQRPVFLGQFQSGIPGEPNPTLSTSMFYKDVNDLYTPGLFVRMTDAPGYNIPNYQFALNVSASNSLDYVVDTITINEQGGVDQFYLWDGGMIGASEMAFVYNDSNGDGRFSFQYMHSPLYNNGNESVGTFNITQSEEQMKYQQTAYLTAYSGIMFVNTYTNMSNDPRNDPFLSQLGFKYDDIVSPDVLRYFNASNKPLLNNATNYNPLSYRDTFLKYTTRNKMTLGNLITPATQTISGSISNNAFQMANYSQIYTMATQNHTTAYNFNTSTVTEPIKATNPPISSNNNAGHYLIELQCSYVNEYINQDKNYQIKAIVGNYFLSGDSFCMSMGPDSYIYQHNGEPTALSAVKVRILNPVTKEPALELGNNSCVYLQITKEKPVNINEKQTDKTIKAH